jgi:hypothetical protein
MNLEELKKMTKKERLQAMEAVWDSFLHENEELETPKWHEEILLRRRKSISNGEARFVSLAELKASRAK